MYCVSMMGMHFTDPSQPQLDFFMAMWYTSILYWSHILNERSAM